MILVMMRRFLAALRFLTIAPVAGGEQDDAATLAAGVGFFPLIGLLIGLVAAGAAFVLGRILPPGLLAVALALLFLGVSGGLHMDGLADTADGFFSARPREEMLAIMRDSRIGAMGVIAVFFVLAVKIAAIAAIPAVDLWRAVMLAPIAGRVALLLSMALLPYARPEGGLGLLFYGKKRRISAALGIIFLAGCAFFAAGERGLVATAGVVAVVICFAGWCRKKIGGATGDTLGAACEIAEAVLLVGFCIG